MLPFLQKISYEDISSGDNFRVLKEIEMGLLTNILRAWNGRAEKAVAINEVIDDLKLISRMGRHVSEHYQLCGEVYGDEKDFCDATTGSMPIRRLDSLNWLHAPRECS